MGELIGQAIFVVVTIIIIACIIGNSSSKKTGEDYSEYKEKNKIPDNTKIVIIE